MWRVQEVLSLFRPLELKSRGKYRLWLRYSDGAEGEVDLSALAGKGVFRIWDEPGVFDRAYITPYGAVAWSEDVEICPDSLYIQVTGKRLEDVYPGLKSAADA